LNKDLFFEVQNPFIWWKLSRQSVAIWWQKYIFPWRVDATIAPNDWSMFISFWTSFLLGGFQILNFFLRSCWFNMDLYRKSLVCFNEYDTGDNCPVSSKQDWVLSKLRRCILMCSSKKFTSGHLYIMSKGLWQLWLS